MARNMSREKQFGGIKSEPMEEPGNENEQMDVEKPTVQSLLPVVKQFDESLLKCDVCLDIMHVPVNCSPCNHKFCASCIYRWLDTHYTCPKCRYLVKEATKDVFASQICDEFYNHHPERIRSQVIIDDLDRIELEYLEKLIERAKGRNFGTFHLDDSELDHMNPNDFEEEIRNLVPDNAPLDHLGPPNVRPPRRLFLSVSRRFRLAEWEQRSERLRLKFNLPARKAPTPPEVPNTRVHTGGRRVRISQRDFMRLAYGSAPFYESEDSSEGEERPDNGPNRTAPIGDMPSDFILRMIGRRRRTPLDERPIEVVDVPDPNGGGRRNRSRSQRGTRNVSNQMPERTREERARARELRAQARNGNTQPAPPPTRPRPSGSTPRANNRSEPYNLRRRRS